MAADFIPVTGVTETELAEAALRSSMADDTPEGRSIVELARVRDHLEPPTWRAPSSSRSRPRRG
jgi:K+-transporting ATPase ATPase B chain